MKCGPSICGIGGIQIWQRRISRVPLGIQKNVYGFLHTRSSDGHQAIIFNAGSRVVLVGPHWAALRRPGYGVPLALTRE